jgi:hypothetical protein
MVSVGRPSLFLVGVVLVVGRWVSMETGSRGVSPVGGRLRRRRLRAGKSRLSEVVPVRRVSALAVAEAKSPIGYSQGMATHVEPIYITRD